MDNLYFGLLYFQDYDPRFRFWCAVRYTFYRICAHILVWQDAWASPSKFDIETCLQYFAQFWLTVEPVVAWKADLPCWISWVQWLLFSQMKFLNNNRYIEVRINRTIWLWLIFFFVRENAARLVSTWFRGLFTFFPGKFENARPENK